ncbi:MAG: ribosomal protein S5 [Patescibacteria group bacterium]
MPKKVKEKKEPAIKKEEPEFEQKLLDVRRTARMVAGGRRFSFRAVVIIGNKKGKVGVGVAKGADVTMAVEKAVRQAKKDIIQVPITDDNSIAYRVEAKYGAAKVMLKPASKGKGVIAGGTVRAVCNLAGIGNITAKVIGRTTNQLNNARATILALKKLS